MIHAVEVAFESICVSGPEPTEQSQPGIHLLKWFRSQPVETAETAEMRYDVRSEYSRSNAENAAYTHPNTTSNIAAEERERVRTERRMDSTTDSAAKEREQGRTERRVNSPSQRTAAPPKSGSGKEPNGR